MVIDHIHNHLDAGSMQFSDGSLELSENVIRAHGTGSLGGVSHVRGEVIDGVVAPVVDKPQVHKSWLGYKGLYRQ